MKGKLNRRVLNAFMAFVFAWIQCGGTYVLADSPRWAGKNERLQKEAITPNHQLVKILQQTLDSGIYDGKEGDRLYLEHLEKGLDQMVQQAKAKLKRMSDRELQEKWEVALAETRKFATESGNEGVLQYLGELESNSALTAREKLLAFDVDRAMKELRRAVIQEIRAAGSVTKMLQQAQSKLMSKSYRLRAFYITAMIGDELLDGLSPSLGGYIILALFSPIFAGTLATDIVLLPYILFFKLFCN